MTIDREYAYKTNVDLYVGCREFDLLWVWYFVIVVASAYYTTYPSAHVYIGWYTIVLYLSFSIICVIFIIIISSV